MENSSGVIEVLKAINNAKKAMKPLKKTKTSADGMYKYVTLDDVLEVLKKTLPRFKLGFVQVIESVGELNYIKTIVFHDNGQFISTSAKIPCEKDDFLSAVQSVGAAVTYMRRYALCTIFGIVSEDDVDGNCSPKCYSEADKEIIQQKIKENKLSGENVQIIQKMVKQNCSVSSILKKIESMK